MNIYYRIFPICENYGHLSLIIRKDELRVRGESLQEIVRRLQYAARCARGSLGLVQEEGVELRINTVHPLVLDEFKAGVREGRGRYSDPGTVTISGHSQQKFRPAGTKVDGSSAQGGTEYDD